MIKFISGMIIGFALLYMIQDHEHGQPIPEEDIDPTFPERDPKRKVYAIDWKHNKFVYSDEVEPVDSTPIPITEELEYQPDYTVRVEGSRSGVEIVQPQYVVSQGKRYKVYVKPNGTIELKPWR